MAEVEKRKRYFRDLTDDGSNTYIPQWRAFRRGVPDVDEPPGEELRVVTIRGTVPGGDVRDENGDVTKVRAHKVELRITEDRIDEYSEILTDAEVVK
jgi:hypothetical protein